VHSDGKITPCCYTGATDIEQLKEKFTTGEQPAECQYCWQCESAGVHSPREDFSRTLGTSVKMLSINLGNYCNAECIMCNGYTSSSRNTWAKIYNPGEFKLDTIQVANTDIDFSLYPDLEMITLIGGEPALHPSTGKILDKLIELGIAPNITISLNTNASRFDDKLIAQLKQFKDIFVTLSIDGAGEYFEYQRRPLKWTTVQPIALQWMQISKNIVINYVVTAISIWGFNEFVRWVEQLPQEIKDKQPQIILTPVSSEISWLGLSVLNNEQRHTWVEQAVNHPKKQDILTMLASAPYTPCPDFARQIALEDATAKKKFKEIFADWKLDE
jgi:sulfatase maturation enzyme AslB (radical SAM superfamily)